MGKLIKFNLFLSGFLFVSLLLCLALHNIRTALTGQEDKLFFFVFILLFFILPVFLIFTIIMLSVAWFKNRAIEKKKENYEKNN